MNPMPGSWPTPRVSSRLSSCRIWSPTRSGRNVAICNSKFKIQNAQGGTERPTVTCAPCLLSEFCISHFESSAPLRSNGHALHRKHLDDVADLEVVVVGEADAAFEAGLDLADVVLEAAQRPDLPLVHDDVVAEQACVRVAGPCDAAVGHHAAGDGA